VWSRRRTPAVGPRALPLAVCRVSAHGRAACRLLNPKNPASLSPCKGEQGTVFPVKVPLKWKR